MTAKDSNNLDNFPARVLFSIGLVDLIRGFLHTINIQWAVTTFAKLDLSSARNDQLFLLGIFGISNLLTGALYILISQKAKNLSAYILGIIPLAYGVGLIGLKYSRVSPQSAFLGRSFMLVYLGVCGLSSLLFFFKKFTGK